MSLIQPIRRMFYEKSSSGYSYKSSADELCALRMRFYEGKAVLANIIFPMILYCSIRIYQDEEDRALWIYLFLCNLTGITFSGSAFMAVFAGSGAILPIILLRFLKMRKEMSIKNAAVKCRKWIVPWFITMMPIFCWAFAYILVKLQVISLKIK